MPGFRLDLALLGAMLLLSAACGRIPETANSSPSPAQSATSAHTPLTIPGPTMHPGEVGIAYAPVTIRATGGNNPFLWRVGSGALPDGLSVSLDGVVSGTPATAGASMFTLEVTDASLATANVAVSITVVPRLAVSLTRSGVNPERQGSSAGGPYAYQTGGSAPFEYSVASGSMPAGTRLDGLVLRGTFSSAGSYGFTVKVTDALGATASVSPSYYVWGPIAFPPLPDLTRLTADQRWHYADGLCYGSTISGCSARFGYTGGTPGVTPSVSYTAEQGWGPWAPPGPLQGLSVTAANGAVSVGVAPNANPNASGEWKVYVTLTDPQTGEATSRPAEFVVEFLYYPPPTPAA